MIALLAMLGIFLVVGLVYAFYLGYEDDQRRFAEDRRMFRARAAESMREHERRYRERAERSRPELAGRWHALADEAAAYARNYEGGR